MGFFKLGDALNEFTSAIGAKDTAIAGAKLIGKTLFNTGKLAGEIAIKAAEKQSGNVLKRNDLTDEQREKAEKIHARAKETIDSKIEKIDDEIKRNEKIISGNKYIKPEKRDEIIEQIDSLKDEKRSYGR
jgi:uncharacterized protein YlzI (FlbEa/FlbD family)